MKPKKSLAFTYSLIVACSMPALAGTVITNNLPANTAIVNINAKQDGITSFGPGQALCYRPFYTGGSTQLLKYAVSPGRYSFRIVNPTDAVQLFPALTPEQTNQIFTAWTFNSPWVTGYLVFGSAAETNFSLPQLFDGACTNLGGSGPYYPSADSAYAAAFTNASYNKLRASPLGRNATVFTNWYTFTNAETLIFAVPDNILSDNGGGVSVVVSAVRPRLDIAVSGAAAVLSWTTNLTGGFVLQESTNLALVEAWAYTTNFVNLVNGNYQVTVHPEDAARFYRLILPWTP